ncbi:hypothetical protein GCM10011380_27060 [Sphingomonas metalli]|uniref:Uncharacterized protein n=1 Tax=Sphingomonas metalli TaxID=1779358 RepID=A0A916TAB2_9SPHN|nr:DUF3237 domain-containing protein [Sphingomonas metalli]GGB36261.1 hypothetical protein GCM10011380_27060 [Sphingomonas metalli]
MPAAVTASIAAMLLAGAVPPTEPAPSLEPVFAAEVLLGESIDAGRTPLGGRSLIRITGGRFEGARIRGAVLPGGWDWQLHAEGGCTRLHADYMLRTDDGVTINIVNDARLCPDAAGKPAALLSTPAFEAPLGRYAWLNGGAYVGTIAPGTDQAHPSVHIRIYRAVPAAR